jgi:NTP pyrophosphatase (non-canonical NTP hydrolase)
MTKTSSTETQSTITAWITETFGEPAGKLSNPAGKLSIAARANEEMAELIMALAIGEGSPKVIEECADIVILLYQLAERMGHDLHTAINAKMAVNRAREWTVRNGIGYHERDRDYGGRLVREAWVRWAKTQPSPKASWLVPYEELSEPDKEADRQIAEALWNVRAPPPAPEAQRWRNDAFQKAAEIVHRWFGDAAVGCIQDIQSLSAPPKSSNPPDRRIRELEEALKFYGAEWLREAVSGLHFEPTDALWDDKGQRARAVLQGDGK